MSAAAIQVLTEYAPVIQGFLQQAQMVENCEKVFLYTSYC